MFEQQLHAVPQSNILLWGVTKVVTQLRDVARTVTELIGYWWQPQNDADHDCNDRMPSQRGHFDRRAKARRSRARNQPHHQQHDKTTHHSHIRHVRLRAQRARYDQSDQRDAVAFKHRPYREQHDDKGHEGYVRIPRLSQHVAAVSTKHKREHCGDRQTHSPATASERDHERADNGEGMDEYRAHFQRVGGRAEQTIGRREQIEAERSRVTALIWLITNSSRQANERRVPCADITHPELCHRQVEHRIPMVTAQRDKRNDQRQAYHRGQQHDHSCPTRPTQWGHPSEAFSEFRHIAPFRNGWPCAVCAREPARAIP